MSRYDIEKFEPPPDPDLVCCICQCVLDKAVESPCRHVFCQGCIERWLSNRHTCPTCRERTRKQDLKPVLPLVQNMLNRLMMFCDYRANGCLEKVMLEYYERHMRNCGYEMKTCHFSKCGRAILKMHLEQHESGECEHRETVCPGECKLMIALSDKNTHNCVRALKTHIDEKNQMIETLKTKLQELNSLSQSLSDQLDRLRQQLDDNRPRSLSISSYSSSDTDVTEFMSNDLNLASVFDENSSDLPMNVGIYSSDDVDSVGAADYDPAADDTIAGAGNMGNTTGEGASDVVEQVERTVVNSLFDLTSRLERVRHQMRSVLDNGRVYDNNNLNDELHISSARLDAIVNSQPGVSTSAGTDNQPAPATSTSAPDHTYNLRSVRVDPAASTADMHSSHGDDRYHHDNDESGSMSTSDVSNTHWDSDHEDNQNFTRSGDESVINSIPSTSSPSSSPMSSQHTSLGSPIGTDHSYSSAASRGSYSDRYSVSTPVPSGHTSPRSPGWAEARFPWDDESRDSFTTIHSISSVNGSNSVHSSKYSEIGSSSIPSSPGSPRSFQMTDNDNAADNHASVDTDTDNDALSGRSSDVSQASSLENSAVGSNSPYEDTDSELAVREEENSITSNISVDGDEDDYSSTVTNDDDSNGRTVSDSEQDGSDRSFNVSERDQSIYSVDSTSTVKSPGTNNCSHGRIEENHVSVLAEDRTSGNRHRKNSVSELGSRYSSDSKDYTDTDEMSPCHSAHTDYKDRQNNVVSSVLNIDSDNGNYSHGQSPTHHVHTTSNINTSYTESEASDNDVIEIQNRSNKETSSVHHSDAAPQNSSTHVHGELIQSSLPTTSLGSTNHSHLHSATVQDSVVGSEPGEVSETESAVIATTNHQTAASPEPNSKGNLTVLSNSSKNDSAKKFSQMSVKHDKEQLKVSSPVHLGARIGNIDNINSVGDSGISSSSQSGLEVNARKQTRYNLRSNLGRKRKLEQSKCSNSNEDCTKRSKLASVNHNAAHMYSSSSQTEQNPAQNVNVKIDLSLINLSGQILPQTSTCTNATVIQSTANVVPSCTSSRNQKQFDSSFGKTKHSQQPSDSQPRRNNKSGAQAGRRLPSKISARSTVSGNKQARSRRHTPTNTPSNTRGRSPITSSPTNLPVTNRDVSGNRDFPNSWRDVSESDSESSDSTWGPDSDAAETDVTFTEESDVETDSSYEVAIPKSTLGLLEEYASADTDDTWTAGSATE